ncbi:hypothetical protein CLV98_10828 [Dyadobacter jejuensis]|uniref:Viral A-type inclusion protein n=1 Tax=Dyadobacter jejuensis TaxID=1082580 RepID=A0A316AIK3_9BACT|nr:viral A-type inclusion protein [Dyadobacter jejuensis]PWJ57108.1 hypothetical protein CLV98_10828 [Dyadobacter jejuensis]
MKQYLAIIFLFCLLGSCSDNKEQVNELEKEVLDTHDDVMAYMDDIMTLRNRIKKELASIDSLENEGIADNNGAQQRLTLQQLDDQLDQSDAQMMQWMRAYNGDSAKNLNTQEAMRYFEVEKEKIDQLKSNTEKSVQEVKTYFEKQNEH